MGWHNPPLSWNELERTLSGEEPPAHPTVAEPRGGRADPGPVSRRRQRTPPAPIPRPADAVPYAELHAHSSYSFLDGASSPEELLAEAERLGLTALALTDHDGFYGAARFAEVADLMEAPLQTVFGAELSLELPAPQRGTPDPLGEHLLVLARGMEGYHRLSGAITTAQLRGGEKGRPVYDLDELAASAGGQWTILTGCRKGSVRRGLERGGRGDSAPPARRPVRRGSRRRRALRPRRPAGQPPQRRPRRARHPDASAGGGDEQCALCDAGPCPTG